MNKEKLKKFKRLFEAQRQSLLFNDRIVREDFGVCTDDRYDEVDQATTDCRAVHENETAQSGVALHQESG